MKFFVGMAFLVCYFVNTQQFPTMFIAFIFWIWDFWAKVMTMLAPMAVLIESNKLGRVPIAILFSVSLWVVAFELLLKRS